MLPSRLHAALLLGAAALCLASPLSKLEPRKELHKCYDGPYLIVAHGSNEHGEGALGSLTDAFQEQIIDSGSEGFHYPSTITNYTYSEPTGVHHLKQHIRSYINHCGKKSRIMLLGYSQGAQVVTDTLSGGTFSGSRGTDGVSLPLKKEFGKNIYGVLLFGDPAFTAGESWDAGTSTHDGLFPRSPEQLQYLQPYVQMMKSYCDKNDPYCAGGKKTDKNLQIHGEYFQKYGTEAVSWLVSTWKARR